MGATMTKDYSMQKEFAVGGKRKRATITSVRTAAAEEIAWLKIEHQKELAESAHREQLSGFIQCLRESGAPVPLITRVQRSGSVVVASELVGLYRECSDWASEASRLIRTESGRTERGSDIAVGYLTDDEKAMAKDQNRKIDAIKAFRHRTGLGLKEAMDVVNAYLDKVGISRYILAGEKRR